MNGDGGGKIRRTLAALGLALAACTPAPGTPPSTGAVPPAHAASSEPAAPRAPLADRDGDGVTDDSDACPDVPGPSGANPKSTGCPKFIRIDESRDFFLQAVHFLRGQANVMAESAPVLDETLEALKENPDIRMEVVGHASADEPGGVRLSEARSRAVVAWLVAHGVEARRVTALGKGATEPIEDETNDEARQQNRRVEFRVVEKGAGSSAP